MSCRIVTRGGGALSFLNIGYTSFVNFTILLEKLVKSVVFFSSKLSSVTVSDYRPVMHYVFTIIIVTH